MTAPVPGRVDPRVAEEFPELRLWTLELGGGRARSAPQVRERLRHLSDRFLGGHALQLRAQPIPHAYRVFHRHIGLDPDEDRVLVEQVVLERLRAGRFKSRSLLDDALTIAVMETNVPLWALDADTISGDLEIRPAVEREPLGRRDERAPWLPEGRLVVADGQGPVALLCGDVAAGHGVTRETERTLLFSVQVAGVPAIHVEEAFWIAADALGA